jgi:hypothetical protein
MELSLTYDASVDAWTLRTQGALNTPEDVERWRERLTGELAAIGRKIYLLVDMSEFQVSAAMSDSYGRGAKEVAERYAKGIVRYGRPKGTTATTVRLEAVINRFPPNVYPDREAALAALKEVRSLAGED